MGEAWLHHPSPGAPHVHAHARPSFAAPATPGLVPCKQQTKMSRCSVWIWPCAPTTTAEHGSCGGCPPPILPPLSIHSFGCLLHPRHEQVGRPRSRIQLTILASVNASSAPLDRLRFWISGAACRPHASPFPASSMVALRSPGMLPAEARWEGISRILTSREGACEGSQCTRG